MNEIKKLSFTSIITRTYLIDNRLIIILNSGEVIDYDLFLLKKLKQIETSKSELLCASYCQSLSFLILAFIDNSLMMINLKTFKIKRDDQVKKLYLSIVIEENQICTLTNDNIFEELNFSDVKESVDPLLKVKNIEKLALLLEENPLLLLLENIYVVYEKEWREVALPLALNAIIDDDMVQADKIVSDFLFDS
jgi:hypothetical protein